MPRFRDTQLLPAAMRGEWVDPEDGATLSVSESEVCFQGASIQFDWFEISETGGALSVNFGVDDEARIDSFARENLTGLVIDPEGQFHGYNTKFGCLFVRRGQTGHD